MSNEQLVKTLIDLIVQPSSLDNDMDDGFGSLFSGLASGLKAVAKNPIVRDIAGSMFETLTDVLKDQIVGSTSRMFDDDFDTANAEQLEM